MRSRGRCSGKGVPRSGPAITIAVSSWATGLLELGKLQLELGDDLGPPLGELAVLLTPCLGGQ
jgi:hypothetical protein